MVGLKWMCLPLLYFRIWNQHPYIFLRMSCVSLNAVSWLCIIFFYKRVAWVVNMNKNNEMDMVIQYMKKGG